MKTNPALAILLWSCVCSSNAQLFHSDYDCNEGSELAVLDFFTDSNAQENGWTLVCDGDEKVWDIQVGSLVHSEGTWLTESSCIPTTTTCFFTFLDQGEDGLSGEGFFAFRYGATTLAVAEYGASMSFKNLEACFGPSCDETPLEVEDEQEDAANQQEPEEDNDRDEELDCTDDEEEVVFDIILDENPLDNGWSLACDNGDVLWNIAAGSIADTTGSWVTETACVAKTLTCTFLITDATGDGLTANGFFALRYGATTVAASEYGEAVAFDEEAFCFGPDCQRPALEDGEVADTTDTTENVDTADKKDLAERDADDVKDSVKIGVEGPLEAQDQEGSNAILIGSVVGGVAVFFCLVVIALMICRKQSSTTRVDIYANKGDDTDSRGAESDNGDSALVDALRGVTLGSGSVTTPKRDEENSLDH